MIKIGPAWVNPRAVTLIMQNGPGSRVYLDGGNNFDVTDLDPDGVAYLLGSAC